MTKLVPIKEGQWVLAFPQPYGLYDEKTIEQHLEQFSRRGGGWDTHRKEEIFAVLQVEKVMPQTYTPANGSRFISKGERQYRFNVIAAGDSEAEMIALRDRLYAIGDGVDDRIEAEMYRRIEKFAAREQEKGLKRVKRLLPHIYGRGE